MSKVCNFCGNVLNDDDKFCTKCGAVMGEQSANQQNVNAQAGYNNQANYSANSASNGTAVAAMSRTLAIASLTSVFVFDSSQAYPAVFPTTVAIAFILSADGVRSQPTMNAIIVAIATIIVFFIDLFP